MTIAEMAKEYVHLGDYGLPCELQVILLACPENLLNNKMFNNRCGRGDVEGVTTPWGQWTLL